MRKLVGTELLIIVDLLKVLVLPDTTILIIVPKKFLAINFSIGRLLVGL